MDPTSDVCWLSGVIFSHHKDRKKMLTARGKIIKPLVVEVAKPKPEDPAGSEKWPVSPFFKTRKLLARTPLQPMKV